MQRNGEFNSNNLQNLNCQHLFKLPKDSEIMIKSLDWKLRGLIQPSTTIDWRIVLVLFFFSAFHTQIFHIHIAILNALPAALQGAGT
ncbi:LOW QUALITY PROTEIN: uncharacterized protein LOC116801433 [Drosophila sechellia]|uniref:LOW QUALITY PROTEIN: uncharacterized protein LOC116801433 n=1 Tax=Drosophila sechellia TaxID=7238 RepID=UPI0013DDDA79|nr:LOW QUALITY PROTEIN: uncharacterized protein LOC116801433 [Drosophila sechellia]